MKKVINDKVFKINDNAEVRCSWFKTNYGFKYEAELYYDGIFQCSAKVCYQNRTWESFEYETVLSAVLRKAHLFDDSIAEIINRFSNKNVEEVKSNFGMLAGIMQLGNIFCNDKKGSNDWKERMLRAGLETSGLVMPEDWPVLPEAEKEKRLNGIIELFNK
jgi:hypothetical protein